MTETTANVSAKRRTSASRLLLPVFVSILLFVGLALGEDYGRRFLDRREAIQAEATKAVAAEKAVRQYVEALSETYLKGSPTHVDSANVATAKQVRQIRLFMSYNHFEKKQKLLVDLKSQEIEDVRISGGEATVTATETWDYAYIDEATRKQVSRQTQTVKVEYALIKAAGNWLVDSLVANEVKN